MHAPRAILSIVLGVGSLQIASAARAFPAANLQAQEAGQAAVSKKIGAIKAIDGSTITLTPDSGSDTSVTVSATTRMLKIAPGEKSLKNATPVQLQELQVGDTIRVRGLASDDAKSIAALEIVVITSSALEGVRDQIRQDWQKRGLGGLVHEVDAQAGNLTISITGFGGSKTIVVHTSKNTVIRRYAPDSVKFDDVTPSALLEIHPGDQLRARGDRSADGSEFTAIEIVAGSFQNVAGTVNSVDANAGTLMVQDVLSKKAVQVKVTAESQLRKLPTEMAQRIAMRLKGAATGGQPAVGVTAPTSASSGAPANGGQAAPSGEVGRTGGGMRSGGAPDLQQMLSHMPAVTLADLHKGDAVMMVTTQGTASTGGTAITLLSGVEPILEAAPNGSQAMMLAPWSLGGPSGDAASQ